MTNTLLYLSNTPARFNVTTQRGTWTGTATTPANRRLCLSVFNSNVTVSAADGTTNTSNQSFFLGRWTSDSIVKAGTLSGTMQYVMAVREQNAAQNAVTKIHAWVTQGDTQNLRGTLISNDVGPTEWPVSNTTNAEVGITDTITISAVDVEIGDRVVIEIGYQIPGAASTTSYTGFMRYGGEAQPDLANGNTNTGTPAANQRPPWVMFSDPNSVLPIPISTLVDDFDTGADYDTSKWSSKSSGVTPTQSGGVMNVPTVIGGSQYVESDWVYTLAGSSVSVQLIPPTIDGSTAAYGALTVWTTPDFNNWVQIRLDAAGGFLGFLVVDNGTTVFNKGYTNPEPGAWVLGTPFVRIRETGGDLFFDVSQDGTNWVPMTDSGDPVTTPTPALLLAATDLTIDLTAGRAGGGTNGTLAAPAQFDNFNFAPEILGPEPGRMLLAVS